MGIIYVFFNREIGVALIIAGVILTTMLILVTLNDRKKKNIIIKDDTGMGVNPESGAILNFCPQCGGKIEETQIIYCPQCGKK